MPDLNKYVVALEAETRKYRRQLDVANRKLSRFQSRNEKSVSKLNATWKKFGVGIAATLAVAAPALNKFLRTTREFEQLNANLETVTGSAQAARLAFENIERFAAQTPFQLAEVTQAFILLRNRGLDATTESLTAFGNLAASNSRSLRDTVTAIAQGTVREFESLKSFGISAKVETDKIKFTFKGLTSEVEKNAKAIEKELLRLVQLNFAGGMERQVATLDGALSNFEDAVDTLIRKIDSETGLTGAIANAVRSLTDWVNELAGVPRGLETIQAEIDTTIAKINALADAQSQAGRRRNRAGGASRGQLQLQLDELEQELLDAQLKSQELSALEALANKTRSQISETAARIVEGRRAGEEEFTQGTGSKNRRRRTDLGRDIQQLDELGARLAFIQLRIDQVEQAATEAAAQNQRVAQDIATQNLAKWAEDAKSIIEGLETESEKAVREFNEAINGLLKAGLDQDELDKNVLRLSQQLGNALTGLQFDPDIASKEGIAELNRVIDEEIQNATDNANELNDIVRGMATGLDALALDFAATIERITTLAAALNLPAEQTQMLLQMAADNFKKLVDEAEKAADEMTVFWEQAMRNMQDALANFLFDPFDDGLKGMLKGFVDTLRRMAAELLASKIFDFIKGLGKGGEEGGGGGFFKGLKGLLGFADGGIVPGPRGAPRLAVVHGGEAITPPPFEPMAIGRINGSGRELVEVTQNLTVNGASRAEMLVLGEAIRQQTKSDVFDALSRTGKI